MNKILFMIMLSSYSMMLGGWERIGSSEKLILDSTMKITNFILSENSDEIITYDTSKSLKRWKIESGEFVNKISFPSTVRGNEKFIRQKISSDLKSIIYEFKSADPLKIDSIYSLIFDINDSEIIDSFALVDIGSSSVDYNRKTKSLISWGNWSLRTLKNDSNGKIKSLVINVQDGLSFFGKNNDKILYNTHTYQYGGYGNSWWFSFYFVSAFLDLNNYEVKGIADYSKSLNKERITESGNLINVKNGVLLDDTTIVVLSKVYYGEGPSSGCDCIYSINQMNDSINNTISLWKKENNHFLNLENNYVALSSDSSLLFLYDRDSIHVFGARSFLYCNSFGIKGASNIIKTLNSLDGKYIFILDDEGSLFRFRSTDAIGRKADFSTNDSICKVRDTVSFINISKACPTQFYWDFGDSIISEDENPFHSYNYPGQYFVKFVANYSGYSDTIIKSIVIYPEFKAKFEYDYSGEYPIFIHYKNKSTGHIDSVQWTFGDGASSNDLNPVHDFYIKGKYKIQLKVFSHKWVDSVEAEIDLDLILPSLDKHDIIREFDDTIHFNGEALRGYQEIDGSIIYLLRNNKTYNYGILGFPRWDFTDTTEMDIIKRGDIYSLFFDGSFYNFDKNGIMSHQKSITDYTQEKLILNTNMGQLRTDQSSNISFVTVNKYLEFKAFNIDKKNNIIDSFNLWNFSFSKLPFYNFKFKKSLINFRNKEYDFLCSYFFDGFIGSLEHVSNVNNIINKSLLKFGDLIDLARLNDSILVICTSNRIGIIKNSGLSVSENKLDSTKYEYISQIELPECKLNNILILNNMYFLVCGRSNGMNAYIICDINGKIIKKVELIGRFGEFNFASLSPDSNLVLSGYRFSSINFKTPYYLISRDSLFKRILNVRYENSKLFMGNDGKLLLFPNPATDFIEISLGAEKAMPLQIRIYDVFGREVNLTLTQSMLGEEEDNPLNPPLLRGNLKIDVSSLTPGVYFVRVGGRVGKFVKLD